MVCVARTVTHPERRGVAIRLPVDAPGPSGWAASFDLGPRPLAPINQSGREGTRVKIGTFSRTGERTLYGRTPSFGDLREIARTAEAVGFDSYWLPDHLVYRPHEPEQLGCWEVMTFLGGLAAVTERIALGPLVAATTFRNPALLARMAVSLDEISGGRFLLGLGAGNWEAEHRMHGFPFDHRASRFAEAIQIIAPLLRGEEVSLQGTYYEVTRCELRPRGPSPSGPPVWIGARGERMLRLIAQYADAYNVIWPHDAATAGERWRHMVGICHEVGRDPATLALTVGTHVQLPGDGPADGDDAITGTYEEIAEQLLAFEAVGVSHLVIDFRPETTVDILERCGRVLELIHRGDITGASR